MYIADGDYIKDIEVNDLRNRYTLTKGATQKMVNTDPLPGSPLTTSLPFPSPPCPRYLDSYIWRVEVSAYVSPSLLEEVREAEIGNMQK